MKNWYKTSMPTIKDISSSLNKISEKIKKTCNIKNVYIWGSYLDNINNPNFPLRDIDIIAQTSFNYQDLLSIIDPPKTSFNLKTSQLIEEGFDPEVVKFTKNFISINNPNIDHWCFSKEGKLLHWGPIMEEIDDWNKTKTCIETKVLKETGISRDKLSKINISKQNNWRDSYNDYLNNFLLEINAPSGWYMSEEKYVNIKDKIKEI